MQTTCNNTCSLSEPEELYPFINHTTGSGDCSRPTAAAVREMTICFFITVCTQSVYSDYLVYVAS